MCVCWQHAVEALPEHLKHPPVTTDSEHDSEIPSGSSSWQLH